MAKQNNLMSQREKSIVAKHEAGHAITGWFLQHTDPLLKVSIVPRSSGALGFAQYLPDDITLYSKEYLLDRIAMTLGGRAAEELFTGQISTGASDDLKKVTQIAYGMVSSYGFDSKVGLFNYSKDEQEFTKPFSEQTAALIDEQAKLIINEQYIRAKELLKSKEDLVEKLTEKLFEKETLVYADIVEVLGPRPYGMKKEYEEFVIATQAHARGGGGEEEVKKTEDTTTKEDTTPSGTTTTSTQDPPITASV